MKKIITMALALSGAVAYAQSNYDGRVGINTETPSATLNVKSQTGTDATTNNLHLQNSTGYNLLKVRDNASVVIGSQNPAKQPMGTLFINPNHRFSAQDQIDKGKTDAILLNVETPNNFYASSVRETLTSISSTMTWRQRDYRGHSINFGLIDLTTNTKPFMSFAVGPQQGYPSDKDMTVEHMRITHEGKIGIGTTSPTHKLHINATENPLKLEGLQEGTGSALVVDANGVVKKGSAISTEVKATTTDATCSSANVGAIHYKEISKNGNTSGVFGFCMKKGDEYVWGYMLGGSNIYGTSANEAAFGDGL